MRISDQILISTLMYQCLPKEAISCFIEKAANRSQIIARLMRLDLVEERSIKATGPHRSQKTTDILVLTQAGLHYIRDRKLTEWAGYIDPEVIPLAMDKQGSSTAAVLRAAAISESAYICNMAGASLDLPVHLHRTTRSDQEGYLLPPAPQNDDDFIYEDITDEGFEDTICMGEQAEEQTDTKRGRHQTYSEIVLDAFERYMAHQGDEQERADTEGHEQSQQEGSGDEEVYEEGMSFVDIARAKSFLLAAGSGRSERDFRRCRTTGILSSRSKTVLTYSRLAPSFPWQPWTLAQDVTLLELWRNSNSLPSSLSIPQIPAVIFISSPKQFKQFFLPTAPSAPHKRIQGPLSSEFTNIYAIPKDTHGVSLLRWIMSDDISEELNALTEQLLSSGEYVPFRLGLTEIFSLRRVSDDIPVSICLDMDVRRLLNADWIAQTTYDGKWGLVCTSWQRGYYKAILGDEPEYIVIDHR